MGLKEAGEMIQNGLANAIVASHERDNWNECQFGIENVNRVIQGKDPIDLAEENARRAAIGLRKLEEEAVHRFEEERRLEIEQGMSTEEQHRARALIAEEFGISPDFA